MFERIEPISRGIFRQFATLAFHQVKESDNGRRSLVRHVLKVLWKHGPDRRAAVGIARASVAKYDQTRDGEG